MAMGNGLKRRRYAVLLMDDEAEDRGSINRILSAQGAQVFQARSGTDVLKIVGRHRLDLVVLAVKLPDESGTEILRRIRRVDKGVPVIMVTSHGSVEAVRASMELGAFDYLTRPLDTHAMRQTVGEALASAKA